MPTPRHRRATLIAIGVAGMIWWSATAEVARSLSATPESGAPIACTVAPRSREEIAALLDGPDIATPAPTTAGQTLPRGVPVPTETVTAIEQLVRTWLACQNAGEPLRAWALFSDGYLYRLLSREGIPELAAEKQATPGDPASGGASLVEIRGERLLPDGRRGAIVRLTYPSVPMPKTSFFYFTEVDGRLLIDGILGEISFSVP